MNMSSLPSPGVLRAGSERKSRHKVDREERLPGSKYRSAYFYACAQSRAGSLRWIVRRLRSRVQTAQVNASRILSALEIASQLEQPFGEQYLRRVEGSARAKTLSDAWVWFWEAVHHRRVATTLPTSSQNYGLKIRYVDRAATVKKVASRAIYATTWVPYAGIVRGFATLYRNFTSDTCQRCGKHSAEYVKCEAYLYRTWVHFIDHVAEIFQYALTDADEYSRLGRSAECTAWAEAFLLMDREVARMEGRAWVIFTDMRRKISSTLSAGIPVYRKIKMSYAVISSVFYVATGLHMGYGQWIREYGGYFEYPITIQDVDSMVYLLGHTHYGSYRSELWELIDVGMGRIYNIPDTYGSGSVSHYLEEKAPIFGLGTFGYWRWYRQKFPSMALVYEERQAGYYR